MYFPDDKMKTNRFQVVAIPRPSDYMKRFGGTTCPSSMYSGDEIAPIVKSKIDMLADADRYDELMQQVELERQNNNDGK